MTEVTSVRRCIYQPRCIACQQRLWADFCELQMLLNTIRITHIEYTSGMMFACGCLAAPFCAFHQNSSFIAKTFFNYFIQNALFVRCVYTVSPPVQAYYM